MSMRAQLVQTVQDLLDVDPRLVLLLGDIGVHGFRHAFERHPNRVFNIGILEQSTVGLAAGMAMSGLIPVVHTIAPFLVERSLEQLKCDFGYQRLGGNFVSVGASYDYASLGCTHHCPADAALLHYVPGFEIAVPGTAGEFDRLFRQSYGNGRPTYFRLSEGQNPIGFEVEFGKAVLLQEGSGPTVIAVGTALGKVWEWVQGRDLTVLYYSCVSPFDREALKRHCLSGRILLCEPYYSGVLLNEIHSALSPRPLQVECLGVPHLFLSRYGRAAQHDQSFALAAADVRRKLNHLGGEHDKPIHSPCCARSADN